MSFWKSLPLKSQFENSLLAPPNRHVSINDSRWKVNRRATPSVSVSGPEFESFTAVTDDSFNQLTRHIPVVRK